METLHTSHSDTNCLFVSERSWEQGQHHLDVNSCPSCKHGMIISTTHTRYINREPYVITGIPSGQAAVPSLYVVWKSYKNIDYLITICLLSFMNAGQILFLKIKDQVGQASTISAKLDTLTHRLHRPQIYCIITVEIGISKCCNRFQLSQQ